MTKWQWSSYTKPEGEEIPSAREHIIAFAAGSAISCCALLPISFAMLLLLTKEGHGHGRK